MSLPSGGVGEELACLEKTVDARGSVVKSSEGIMEILEAYDLTGGLRSAAALAGCDHKTVAHYVALRDAGQTPDERVRRPMAIDPFLAKVEGWVDRSNGRIRADVVHEKLTAMAFTGSERSTRGAVAAAKKQWRAGNRRVFHPWIPEPGLWLQFDWGEGPRIGGGGRCCSAWLAWSRFRVVIPTWDRTLPTLLGCPDGTLRAIGGAPTSRRCGALPKAVSVRAEPQHRVGRGQVDVQAPERLTGRAELVQVERDHAGPLDTDTHHRGDSTRVRIAGRQLELVTHRQVSHHDAHGSHVPTLSRPCPPELRLVRSPYSRGENSGETRASGGSCPGAHRLLRRQHCDRDDVERRASHAAKYTITVLPHVARPIRGDHGQRRRKATGARSGRRSHLHRRRQLLRGAHDLHPAGPRPPAAGRAAHAAARTDCWKR